MKYLKIFILTILTFFTASLHNSAQEAEVALKQKRTNQQTEQDYLTRILLELPDLQSTFEALKAKVNSINHQGSQLTSDVFELEQEKTNFENQLNQIQIELERSSKVKSLTLINYLHSQLSFLISPDILKLVKIRYTNFKREDEIKEVSAFNEKYNIIFDALTKAKSDQIDALINKSEIELDISSKEQTVVTLEESKKNKTEKEKSEIQKEIDKLSDEIKNLNIKRNRIIGELPDYEKNIEAETHKIEELSKEFNWDNLKKHMTSLATDGKLIKFINLFKNAETNGDKLIEARKSLISDQKELKKIDEQINFYLFANLREEDKKKNEEELKRLYESKKNYEAKEKTDNESLVKIAREYGEAKNNANNFYGTITNYKVNEIDLDQRENEKANEKIQKLVNSVNQFYVHSMLEFSFHYDSVENTDRIAAQLELINLTSSLKVKIEEEKKVTVALVTEAEKKFNKKKSEKEAAEVVIDTLKKEIVELNKEVETLKAAEKQREQEMEDQKRQEEEQKRQEERIILENENKRLEEELKKKEEERKKKEEERKTEEEERLRRKEEEEKKNQEEYKWLRTKNKIVIYSIVLSLILVGVGIIIYRRKKNREIRNRRETEEDLI